MLGDYCNFPYSNLAPCCRQYPEIVVRVCREGFVLPYSSLYLYDGLCRVRIREKLFSGLTHYIFGSIHVDWQQGCVCCCREYNLSDRYLVQCVKATGYGRRDSFLVVVRHLNREFSESRNPYCMYHGRTPYKNCWKHGLQGISSIPLSFQSVNFLCWFNTFAPPRDILEL